MGAKRGGKKRFWSNEEKVSICGQTRAGRFSCAGCATLRDERQPIHKWLRDPRFAPYDAGIEAEAADFLPVEIEGLASPLPLPQFPASASVSVVPLSAQRVDITLLDGRRILVEGTTALSAVLCLWLRGCPVPNNTRV